MNGEQLWKAYSLERTTANRNALVGFYMPLAVAAAEAVMNRVRRPEVTRDDLLQAGSIGLWKAVEKFDVTAGVRFETFSYKLIHGAVLDHLRSMALTSRRIRRRAKEIEAASDSIYKRTGWKPTREEIQKELRISGKLMAWYERDSLLDVKFCSASKIVAVEDKDPIALSDALPETGEVCPPCYVEGRDTVDYILRDLSGEDRMVMKMYYVGGLGMEAIGSAVGIGESMISRKMTGISQRLQTRREEIEAELLEV